MKRSRPTSSQPGGKAERTEPSSEKLRQSETRSGRPLGWLPKPGDGSARSGDGGHPSGDGSARFGDGGDPSGDGSARSGVCGVPSGDGGDPPGDGLALSGAAKEPSEEEIASSSAETGSCAALAKSAGQGDGGPLAALTTPIREIRRRLKVCRASAPPPKDHQDLLKIWDLPDEAAVSRAMMESRLRFWIFLGAGLAASAAILATGHSLLALAPIPPAIVGAVTALWRLSILRDGHWRAFPCWLRAKAWGLAGKRDRSF